MSHFESSNAHLHPSRPAWENGGWSALPTLASDARAEVCVIGLGATGLTAVGALLERGVDVIGIDARSVASGAAGANGGFLLAGTSRFYHHARAALGAERARRIYRLTLDEIERLCAAQPDHARRIGSLRIAASADELADCDVQYDAMCADGLPVERYSGPEGQGLLLATDAVFNPLARCRTQALTALQSGARLFEFSPALDIRGDAVRTPLATVSCRQVIVAIDGCLESVLPELRDDVRTARLQMLGSAPTNEVRIERAVYYRWGYEYWQQLPDGRVLLGGFRDSGGEQEWTQTAEPSAVVQDKLEAFLRDQLGVQAPITHRWAASVSYSSAALPVLRESRPNVWVLGGYSGTGNLMGPVCAHALVARLYGDGDAFALLSN